jgi:hypothetical protein
MHSMAHLKIAAEKAIKKHGSLRKAGKALGIHYSLLSLLASGQRTTASEATLEKLGLKERRVISKVCGIP